MCFFKKIYKTGKILQLFLLPGGIPYSKISKPFAREKGEDLKNKFVLLLFIFMTALFAGACGKKSSAHDVPKQSEAADEQKKEETESRREGGNSRTAEEGEEKEEKEEKPPASAVKLGDDFDEAYDGFAYLQCETLILKPDEYGERTQEKTLKIFLPSGEYTSVNQNIGYADSRGMDLKVALSPFLLGDDADTLEETLKNHIEAEYDVFFNIAVYDLELSEIETMENGVKGVVKYCYYDKWTDSFMPVYCTYYLTQTADEMVLVEVEINLMDVREGMEERLAELEAFYGFDIAWDAKEAQKKLENFMAAGVPDTIRETTGYLLFELPKGWEADYSYGYETDTFAPGGSVADAGCAISISQEYMGAGRIDITESLSSEAAQEAYIAGFTEGAAYTVEDVKIEAYGSTCMGEAMKCSFRAEREEGEMEAVMFLITNENYFSVVFVMAVPDKFEETLAVAENILANGRTYP